MCEFIKFDFVQVVKCLQLYNAIYIYCIRRYDGPGRHEILTVINAYYGYY